jgi:filamentous hemagglutinin family protein
MTHARTALIPVRDFFLPRHRLFAPGFPLRVITLMLFATQYAHAGPLPDGGSFVAGAGAIRANGTALDITQTTTRGVIDWRSFSIGSGNSVTVNNGTGATLSRVTGIDRSIIDGKLNATGSFYLINPQGVLVGTSGVVTTGGRFVASTLDVTNDAFMNGGPLSLTGDSCGVVVNLGKIGSSQGDVFLISRKAVVNEGTISAPLGTVELAAGSEVLLKDSTSGQQVFVQVGSQGNVVNKGTISAAQINLQAADGNIYALAGEHGELRATGTATRDGHVWLVADSGTVQSHGYISASNSNGSGGTVDTSAKTFDFDQGVVDAAQWNVTAPAYVAGPRSVAALASNLSRGTSITVNATSGDIEVQTTLRWSSDASLTLNASHSVSIGSLATIGNTGAGNLTLRADAGSVNNSGSVTNGGTIDWSQSTGTVSAFYDMNGTYTGGTIRSNPDWRPADYSGLKTQLTAYKLVNTVDDLAAISNDLAGTYALGKDIDASASTTNFTSLGSRTQTAFQGQFDGMDHVIKGIRISGYNESDPSYLAYVGLFSTIGSAGVVRNVGLIDSTANSFVAAVGILAGMNNGLITHAYTSGDVSPVNAFSGAGAGGLVGINNGTIERSGSGATVSGSGELGGLVATNNGLITQSYATGSVNGGAHAGAGGLVGVNEGTIQQSYASGSAGGLGTGGLVDFNNGTITESFASTSIASGVPPSVGGITRYNTGTIGSDVYWDTQTTGRTNGVYEGTAVPDANGLTTAQMSSAASFGPTWNFGDTGVWVIPAGGTHPVLRWQTEH